MPKFIDSESAKVMWSSVLIPNKGIAETSLRVNAISERLTLGKPKLDLLFRRKLYVRNDQWLFLGIQLKLCERKWLRLALNV